MSKPGFKRGIAYAICVKEAYGPQLGKVGRGRPYPPVPEKLKIAFGKAGKWTRLTKEQKAFLAKCRNMEYDWVSKVESVIETLAVIEPNSVRGSMGAGQILDRQRPDATKHSFNQAKMHSRRFANIVGD